jgi:hypothetical protein
VDGSIVSKFEEMAFKYTVQEFSVSLKPFCANYLFNDYDQILYLDSDMYVVSSLTTVFNWLNDRSFIITPHRIHLSCEFNIDDKDEELLRGGIYNMGFFAVKKSEIGLKIIQWWMKKLEDKCYNDMQKSLFVDQRWIDILPSAYPDDILITHHQGCNMAIWNLHERELFIEDNKYCVRDTSTNDVKFLLFFHFSGYNPYDKNIIDQKRPEYSIAIFPFIAPLVDEYANLLLKNEYDKHSKEIYGFNYFSNGDKISVLNRRIYGVLIKNKNIYSPFSDKGMLYKQFKKRKMISKNKKYLISYTYDESKKGDSVKIFNFFLKWCFYILNIDRYQHFLNALKIISDYDSQIFLYKND